MKNYTTEHTSNIEHCPFCGDTALDCDHAEIVICVECGAEFMVMIPDDAPAF